VLSNQLFVGGGVSGVLVAVHSAPGCPRVTLDGRHLQRRTSRASDGRRLGGSVPIPTRRAWLGMPTSER
jgi:hypothetical protein